MPNGNNGLIPPTVNVPVGYSNTPAPGRLEQLYTYNSDGIYTRFSPFTENTGIIGIGPKQPFFYTDLENPRGGLNGLKRYQSRAFPVASSAIDVIRISKFLATGNGILFLGKQYLLQKNQPFNETRIYNPLSPISSVSTKINPFSEKNPSRFIEVGGSVKDTLTSLVGISSDNNPAPPGTVGLTALPTTGRGNSKGLIRADTATIGYNRLVNKSASPKGILDSLKSLPKSLFGGFSTPKQPAVVSFRADEGSYGIHIASQGKFDYFDKNGALVKWGKDYYMRFEAGENGGFAKENIKKNGETSISESEDLLKFKGQFLNKEYVYFSNRIGHERKSSTTVKKYGELIFKNEDEPYFSSDILTIYTVYTDVNSKEKYESKFSDKSSKSVKDIEDGLNRILTKFKESGYDYDGKFGPKQFVDPKYVGINNITQKTKNPNQLSDAKNYIDSYEKNTSRNIHHIDHVKKFSGTNRPDRVNLLSVLKKNGKDGRVLFDPESDENKFDPHRHDQVAFYFHDIVNDRYIPFRNTVKGIAESSNSNWSDVSYIGKSDKLFNYTGFTRSLSFNFNVVAMSIKELLPMWKRINYLTTLNKPSKYSDSNFVIPPMTSITIGDLYQSQPIIIKSINISVPDDALWETVTEKTNAQTDWTFLNNKMRWKGSFGKFAQFPMECSISISGELLEKEQPMVGRKNWGGEDGKFSNNLQVSV